MEERGTSMTDGSPLVNIRQADSSSKDTLPNKKHLWWLML
jgi:hypothetical protein